MDMYVIQGGQPLRGTVTISGSKNACLPLMCAALLAKTPTVLENVPDLRDIRSMKSVLEHMNVRAEFANGRMTIDPAGFDTPWVPYELMSQMRASMYAFGPMIARLDRASVSKPGGCNIGSRPIDLHLKGFRALGVHMNERGGYIHAVHDGLMGAEMSLAGPFGPSVGATCNILMAATLAEGRTVIHDAAREPEIVELGEFLIAMGARISGLGSSTLVIDGVKTLNGVNWTVMPDRIEAATFATAALLTHGDIVMKNVTAAHMGATLSELLRWGAEITLLDEERTIRVRRCPSRDPEPLDLTTGPYPQLATDVQALFVTLLGLTPGTSRVEEGIYQDRFMHVEELNRLGANIRQKGNRAIIRGVERYDGAPVMASDLRAGAALTLAALAAHGESQVRRIYHVERGYEHFERKLAALGANIRREKQRDAVPAFDVGEGGEESREA
ncbi:MAG: UDP-N-acetylglucosamine 1-carboxyvinyltransferase [Candidatus Sumerlaeota bacterium]|nr:UDP-N-acetylglucosamine 1-carboxyvinyltransferase [Candidatus Sumerlaeota bacterium]